MFVSIVLCAMDKGMHVLKRLTASLFFTIILLFCGMDAIAKTENSSPRADVITIDSAIGPAVAEYVSHSIDKANAEHARVIILKINTPGGLVDSTREITQSILNSKVPVIGYVSPKGARAASAGTFIMYASPIAAMAPATNIGAASPISMMSTGDNKNAEVAQKKAMQDLLASIRASAQQYGRNQKWAQEAVESAVSITVKEAKEKNVINVIATDIPDLLKKVNGLKVTMYDNKVVKNKVITNRVITLNTHGLTIRELTPNWRMQFLMVITNPNVTYILLLAGLLCLAVEFFNPGLIFPGVLGVIALAIAAYGLSILPVNYVGLGLILLAVGLFVAEIYASSYGALGIGGAIALTIGSLMLIRSDVEGFSISYVVIAVTVGFFVLVFSGIIYLLVRDQMRPKRHGDEYWVGQQGMVKLINERYWLECGSQLFRIENADDVQVGQKRTIEKMDGARVIVAENES
jgi:membrane-bound serine protease (ClpP class)